MRQTGGAANGSNDDSQVKTETGSLIGSTDAEGGKRFAESIHFMVRPVGIEPTTLSLEETFQEMSIVHHGR